MINKYFASDLDGTIVKNSDFLIPEKTKSDILKFQKDSDHKFTIATGRSFTTAKRYLRELEVKLPIITCNGAVVSDVNCEEIYFQSTIDLNKSISIIDMCIESNYELIYYSAKKMYALKNSSRATFFEKFSIDIPDDIKPEIVKYDNYEIMKESLKKHLPVKFVIILPEDVKTNIKESIFVFLDNFNLEHPTTIMHNSFMIDVMNFGVNKATGIAKLADILNFNKNEIVVFGDNNNDYEMVKQSNFGCVVSNGVEKTKKIAWKILDSVENNGVGIFLSEIERG